jgi:hypothetical protein
MVFQILAYLLPAGAVVLGAIFASEFIRLRRQAAACVAWPTTPGEIIAARVASMIET